jgi:hypothetical protein
MAEQKALSDYLARLAAELSFDSDLAARVQLEVACHLQDAADEQAGSADAMEIAIQRFGSPAWLARQYADVSLLRRATQLSSTILLIAGGVFLVMKTRGLFAVHPLAAASDHLQMIQAVAFSIDKVSFLAAVLLGAVGCIYVAAGRLLAPFRRRGAAYFRRCLFFSWITAWPLALCVIADVTLVVARLPAAAVGLSTAVSLLSAASQICFLAIVVLMVRKSLRRLERFGFDQ